MKKRVDWIDIAKGLAIILMVIGHTIPNNHFMTLIFSFHMPLFIILSGFVYKPLKDKTELLTRLKKYIRKILFPYLITLFICSVIIFCKNYDWNFLNFISFVMKNLIWGNGVGYTFLGINFINIGPIWFLLTLFFAKIIFDLINYKFGHYDLHVNIIIFCFLLLCGIEIGLSIWLPQNFDLVFIFLFYLYIGYLFKQYYNKLNTNGTLLFVVAFMIWCICLGFNINIELAVRKYPYYILSVVESLCASYCVIELCKILCETKLIKNILMNIGRISLIILCVHSIECFLIDWRSLSINIYVAALLRTVIVVAVSFVYNEVGKRFKKIVCQIRG